MLALQTVYLYGLNDRIVDEYIAEKKNRVLGNKVSPFCRVYKLPDYINSKIKLDNSFLKHSFPKILATSLHYNLKDDECFISVSIKSFKKSFLKYYVMISMSSLIEKQIHFLTNNSMQ